MQYSKPSYSVQNQIERLKGKGLQFEKEYEAESFFQYNNYYRWKGYAYHFQDHNALNSLFTKTTHFETITEIYNFDRELRSLIFSSIETIEIALKAQIIYQYSLVYGSHWYLNPDLFRDKRMYLDSMKVLFGEVSGSKEMFIGHYLNKYNDPSLPPVWSCLEIVSFGYMSKFFKNLKGGNCKKDVAQMFGLADPNILDNWIQCISVLRNICAHHGRLWRRKFLPVTIPKNPSKCFVNDIGSPFDLYAPICCIKYLSDRINPNNDFKEKLKILLNKYPSIDTKYLGFPLDWKQEMFWK
ncbi:hypothetical protein MmiEs2_00660 [Methanimicrococcus stummii]|uniref:Abortive infection bacteriophage resistance protein n=2 Tax=Methanimicrococcus stummii TaxID=3028294 RepID=A0AA96V9R9_9EURY|nr:hypothetical protein MmiEs2_00660 [Methanimicrococcus sp. Es2]